MNIAAKLHRAKMTVLGLIFVLLGVLIIAAGQWLSTVSLANWVWLHAVPLSEIGGSLFAIGVVGVAYDLYTRRDEEENAVRRLRSTLRQEAPVMRDAVIRAFAFKPEDLERVATPAVLDRLATNSLALRFGDAAFAREVYTDLLDRAITAPERWYDARVSINLAIARRNSAGVAPSFDILFRWEYTVTPLHQFRRFAVVSDRRRYEELAAEGGDTSVWFKHPDPGIPATDPASFRLVQVTVGDRDCAIVRHADESSQTYVADLGAETILKGEPVTVSFTYVSRTAQSGHLLHLDVDRPIRGLDVELNYADCNVAGMRLLDFVSRGQLSRIIEEPAATNQRVLRFGYDGWALPRAGLTFVWTLDDEKPHMNPSANSKRPPHRAA